MRKFSLFTWVLTVAAVLSLVSVGQATPILPGGSTTTFTAFTPANFSGGSLASTGGSWTLTNPLGGVATGTYQTAVYRDSSTGFLDFLYQISSDSSSTDSVTGASMGSYVGFATNVGTLNGAFGSFAAGNKAPSSAARTPSGQAVDFNFSSFINGGDTSLVLVIATDASAFTSGALNIKDNGVATVQAFAPAAAVPEPSSMLLFGTGLSGVAIFLRRRSKMVKL